MMEDEVENAGSCELAGFRGFKVNIHKPSAHICCT